MCDYNRRIATPQAQNRASSTPAQRLAMTRLRAADAEKRQQSGLGPDFLEALARGLSVVAAFGGERSQMTLSDEIGSASWREIGGQYRVISVVRGELKQTYNQQRRYS